jgi:hypothetical protein
MHESQTTGFLAQLRARVLDLIRSGECATYHECMERVMSEIRLDADDSDLGTAAKWDRKAGGAMTNGVGGAANHHANVNGFVNGVEHELVVPERVIDEGIKALEVQLGPLIGVEGT